MRQLNGQEIVDFIKQRQLHVSRSLRQGSHVSPKLVIVRTNPSPVVDTYMRLKQSYGKDIEVDVQVHNINQKDAMVEIKKLNQDKSVHGIIIQLPLPEQNNTEVVLGAVDKTKDVDGLAPNSKFISPTATAIDWLLAGYNINLLGKKIVIIGRGRLVGSPLEKLWRAAELDVSTLDDSTKDLNLALKDADVIVAAAGQPALIKSGMVKEGAIVVDAGVSEGKNGLVGDVDDGVRLRQDVQITPKRGGVGPLTVSALFDNLLRAVAESQK